MPEQNTLGPLPAKVVIREEGPRDGFQNEPEIIATADKLRIIEGLLEAGVKEISVTSFAHPKWVPQMSDAVELLRRLIPPEGVRMGAFVPNVRGMETALEAGQGKLSEVSFVVSASESHNRVNLNRSVEECLAEQGVMLDMATRAGLKVNFGIGTAFGCPMEGRVPEERVLELTGRFTEMGAQEIIYGDTTGMANPLQVARLFTRLRRAFPALTITAHFHDTRGAGLANVLASLQVGVTHFESCLGGMGGCPFPPDAKATGNICTEDLVGMLEEMGISTGIDLDKLVAGARTLKNILGRDLPGHVMRAGPVRW